MWAYLGVGLTAGILSGLIGIGGGVIVIPVLVYLFKFTQHQAQGTTLAMMVPPIGILAAYAYYRQGHVNMPVAGFLALGFLGGGLIGAIGAEQLSSVTLSRLFGLVLLWVSLKMIFAH